MVNGICFSKNRVKTYSFFNFLLQDKECFQVLLVSSYICKPSVVLKHCIKVLSCLSVPNTKPIGCFISVNDWKVGWIPVVDNEFVFYDLVQRQRKSKHCSSIYIQLTAKSTKVVSGARKASSNVKTIQKDGSAELIENSFSKGSHGQTQDFCEQKSVWSLTTSEQLR